MGIMYISPQAAAESPDYFYALCWYKFVTVFILG